MPTLCNGTGSAYAYTTSTDACSTSQTWLIWNVTSSATTITTDPWPTWTSGGTCNTYTYPVHEPTPAEQERSRQEHEKREAAAARAQELLDSMLTDEQRAEIAAHRYFTVEGGTSKRRYRVRTGMGRHGNIQEIDEKGEPIRSYCVAPRGSIPEADALLGQKLCIEHAEEEFLARANVTTLRRRTA